MKYSELKYEDIHPFLEKFRHQNQNDVIYERIKRGARSLFLNFWKDHFEWQDLINKYGNIIKGEILDFGCGSGNADIFLAMHKYRVHGIDISPIGIEVSNHLKSIQDEEISERLTFTHVDVCKDDLSSLGKFNFMWSSHVFEHISDHLHIFDGLKKIANIGCRLLISVPLAKAYNDPDHVIFWENDNELNTYLSKYIEVEKVDTDFDKKVLRAICRF